MLFRKRTAARLVSKKFVPWLVAYDLAKASRDHWNDHLNARQQKRLAELIRISKGRPNKLTARQRREFVKIVAAFDFVDYAQHLLRAGIGLDSGKKSRKH